MQNVKPNESKENKEREQGGQFDTLSRIFPGLIVIWLGISLFLKEQDILNHGDWWALILIGVGIVFILVNLQQRNE